MTSIESQTMTIGFLGECTVHPPFLDTDYSRVVVHQTIILTGTFEVNGVAYEGPIYLKAYVGSRPRSLVDCGSIRRAGSIGGWGNITDSARSKVESMFTDHLAALESVAADDRWVREQVEQEVRDNVLRAVQSAYRDAYKVTSKYDRTDVDHDAIALDVILNITREEVKKY